LPIAAAPGGTFRVTTLAAPAIASSPIRRSLADLDRRNVEDHAAEVQEPAEGPSGPRPAARDSARGVSDGVAPASFHAVVR
jgi:hypothetical protein